MIVWRVEEVIESFEAAQLVEGSPDIGRFVEGLSDAERDEAVVELIRCDIEYRWNHSLETRRLEAYLDEFPQVFAAHEHRQAIAYEDFRQRILQDQPAEPAEYAHRYDIDTRRWKATKSVAAPLLNAGSPSTAVTHQELLTKFFPEFTPICELGRGAVGCVYLARQGDWAERQVVIKLTSEPTLEPRRMARLQHTNIVPVYSVHRASQWQLICMPFLGYTTLGDVIEALATDQPLADGGNPLLSTVADRKQATLLQDDSLVIDQREVASQFAPDWIEPQADVPSLSDSIEARIWLASHLAQGLAHAHRRGIIHSDLKPSNVLIGFDGEPRLMDFHLAHDSDKDYPRWIGGTLPYMSREQVLQLRSGTPATSADDLFSFGVMLYQLLTGELPHPPPNSTAADELDRFCQHRAHCPHLRRSMNGEFRLI